MSRWQGLAQPPSAQVVSDICVQELVVTYGDESLSEALDHMAVRGLHQLPVVDRGDPQQAVGMLTREAIELACRLTLTREALKPYIAVPTGIPG
jgi:predicted transcriptional regulator